MALLFAARLESDQVYTSTDRDRIRAALVASAREDERITGAALTGSAASGGEDDWSDIDLAFGVSGADVGEPLTDWTGLMYEQHGAVHHVDVVSGATTYRVFLLPNTLQVDLAFSPASEFGPLNASTFRLLFGAAAERPLQTPPTSAFLVGFGWLHALHARSSIGRGKFWQAEYMISGVRDQVLALACLRHGLPAVQGRGMDRLPAEVTAQLSGALVRALAATELSRAFKVATDGLLREIRHSDEALAMRLEGPLTELTLPARNRRAPTGW